MKAQKISNKDGGALVMAMIVVLTFTTLAFGLFKLFQTDAVEAVYLEQHSRAFWMAEAGLEKTWDRLQNDRNFRLDPGSYVPYSTNYTQGINTNDSYKIASVTAAAGTIGTVYTVTSVGYAGTMNRRIRQTILALPGGPNALRSIGGDIVIDANVYIDGDVFVDTGDVTMDAKENLSSAKNPTGIDGYLIVSAGEVDGNGAATVNVIEAPPPPVPSIDMTFWDPYLTNVASYAYVDTNGLAGVSTINITETDAQYYNYSSMVAVDPVTISGTESGQLGFHYMVSGTNTSFSQWTTLESNTVLIVSNDVSFAQNLEFNDDCIVFATGNIYLSQSSDAGAGTGGATIIAQGDVVLAQNMVFNGIIYAEGSVDVGQNAVISGTIVAGGDINVGQNVEITFDPDVFIKPLPGLNNVSTAASLTLLNWWEIAPEPKP